MTNFLYPTSDPTYGDDSSITFKLCLSDAEDSTGGDLQYGDTRCASHEHIDEPPLTTICLYMGHAVGDTLMVFSLLMLMQQRIKYTSLSGWRGNKAKDLICLDSYNATNSPFIYL